MASEEQTVLWNGAGGHAWVELQPVLDRVLEPFQHLLVDAVAVPTGGHVLDVGCGTGATTFALAHRLGTDVACTGIDLSEPMIVVARARAEREATPPSFIVGDAQTYAFEAESYDAIVSRFGVMFFDDPVAAFANLRRAAKPGAWLRFVTWRSIEENPFMTTAERAAAPLLPQLPPRRPDEPGQFSLADHKRVERILGDSQWSEIDVQPLDVECSLAEPDLLRYLTRLGPVGRVLQDVDASTRERVLATVRAAFDRFVHGSEVRFTSACWFVAARQGGQTLKSSNRAEPGLGPPG